MQSPSTTLGLELHRPASSQHFPGERLRAGIWRAMRGCAADTVAIASDAMAMAGAALPARMRLDHEIGGSLPRGSERKHDA